MSAATISYRLQGKKYTQIVIHNMKNWNTSSINRQNWNSSCFTIVSFTTIKPYSSFPSQHQHVSTHPLTDSHRYFHYTHTTVWTEEIQYPPLSHTGSGANPPQRVAEALSIASRWLKHGLGKGLHRSRSLSPHTNFSLCGVHEDTPALLLAGGVSGAGVVEGGKHLHYPVNVVVSLLYEKVINVSHVTWKYKHTYSSVQFKKELIIKISKI